MFESGRLVWVGGMEAWLSRLGRQIPADNAAIAAIVCLRTIPVMFAQHPISPVSRLHRASRIRLIVGPAPFGPLSVRPFVVSKCVTVARA